MRICMLCAVEQALSGHDNLIRLQHVIKAENGRDIYLTFDHMGAYMLTSSCTLVVPEHHDC